MKLNEAFINAMDFTEAHMWKSPIEQIAGEIQTAYENECMRVVQSYGFNVDKEELIKALQYDRGQYDKGFADASKDLDILISQFCVPLGIQTICKEMRNWDMDVDGETWCSINCDKANEGKCPTAKCYKEWIRMKRCCANE